jgi:hypothetical protein
MSAQSEHVNDNLQLLLAQLAAIDGYDARSIFFMDHQNEFFAGFTDLIHDDSLNTLLEEFCKLLPSEEFFVRDTLDKVQADKERKSEHERQQFERDIRSGKINRLHDTITTFIDEQLKVLPTQEHCWQHILDHPKAIITPLAKLSIIDISGCQLFVERLLELIGRKKTELWRSINGEARTLRQDDYGEELQLDKDGLQRSSNGTLHSNFLNTDKMLQKHLTDKVIGWDMFSNKIKWKLRPIWETDGIEPAAKDDAPGLGYRPIHEADITIATEWLNEQGLTKLSRDNTVKHVIRAIAFKHEFNSLHDYLAPYRGKWDKIDRLSADYDLCGKLFKTPYKDDKERALCNMMLRKQLIGLMERGLHPGCDFRTMLHLIGDQRVGKSRWLEALAGPYYVVYRRHHNNPTHSDNYTQMIGYWLGEIPESSRMRQWNYEAEKEFLSGKFDNVRKPYAEDHIDLKRSWAIFGTSNRENEFLTDPTGNTRHFVIVVGWDFDKGEEIPIEWFKQEIRTMLLAQLIHLVEVDKEQTWLDRDQSLEHKDYVTKFEMRNDAEYSIDQALWEAFKQSGLGERVLDFPGIHFDELYKYLQKTERHSAPSKKAVKEALIKFGLVSCEVVNPLKLGRDKREFRWILAGSDCDPMTGERKLFTKDELEGMIHVRTSIYPEVF